MRTFPPKSMGMLPCLVEEAAENHCKKTPMIVNAGDVRESRERSGGYKPYERAMQSCRPYFFARKPAPIPPTRSPIRLAAPSPSCHIAGMTHS